MIEDFGQIYDTYVVRIYRFIVLKVSSQEIAEDLCSEVFVRAFDRSQKEDIEYIQAFLYQIARHIIADYYREGENFRTVPIEAAYEVVDPQDSLFEAAALNSEMGEVREALSSLRDEYQDFIIWRYLDELSIPEIAQITGKTEGNVRVGVHRALGALREKMEV